MEADQNRLKHRNAFNLTAMNFTPKVLADEIKRFIPDFSIDYQVDPVRQEIADSWPNFMDDSCAHDEWGWKPEFDLHTMAADMLDKISLQLAGKKTTKGKSNNNKRKKSHAAK